MLIDLESPLYSQSDVLKMLPALKAKQLQNWSDRGILDAGDQKPGKGSRRKYTPAGVIGLDFLQKATDFGVPPSSAIDMAQDYLDAAAEFLDSNPEVITHADGYRWIPVRPGNIDKFRRATIARHGNEYFFVLDNGRADILLADLPPDLKEKLGECDEETFRRFNERIRLDFGITVEVDYRIAQTVNRMFLLEAGMI